MFYVTLSHCHTVSHPDCMFTYEWRKTKQELESSSDTFLDIVNQCCRIYTTQSALHTTELVGTCNILTLMRIILIQYLLGICPTFHGQFGSQV